MNQIEISGKKRIVERELRDAGFSRDDSKFAVSVAARNFLEGDPAEPLSEHFQMENDQILAAVEAGNLAFAEYKAASELKIERLEAKLTNRPGNGGFGGDDSGARLARSIHDIIDMKATPELRGWDTYLRGRGAPPEIKDMSEVDGPSGGYGVPKVIGAAMESAVVAASPIWQNANVVPVTTSDYHVVVNPRGWPVTWIGETAARPATGTPQLIDVPIPPREVYANPQASGRLVDDFQWNTGQWLVDELGVAFGESESNMFLNGTGALQPQGILTAPTSAADDSTRPWGTIMYIPTGLAGGFVASTATANATDVLNVTAASLKAGYLDDAKWYMNRSTYAVLLQLKSTIGAPIVMPSMAAGVPETLLGYPIVRCDHMPNIGAGTFPIMFGNLKRAYTITSRFGTRVLVDPFSNKPMVSYYATRRTGGALVNTSALRFVKVAVS